MILINDVLDMLRGKLELVLQNAQPHPEKWVVLSNLVNQDGSVAEGVKNKIVLSVVSLQSDTSTSAFVPPSIGRDDRFPVAAPPLFVDVHLLAMANFPEGNYATGIGMLSRVISYFQETPVFTPQTAAELPEGMDKLAIEFVNLDFAQANNLLAACGAKGLPHVLYRLRRLPFAGPAISGTTPAVRSAEPRGESSPAGDEGRRPRGREEEAKGDGAQGEPKR